MKALVISLAAALAASGAQAADLATLNAALRRDPKPPVAPLKLASPYAEAHSLKLAGIARTSVERRSDAAAAALGFLCGIQDSPGRQGASAAFGSDPHGRFLGAKLSLAFR